MKKRIIDLGALYVGKVGALAVGFFLMPAYSLILGADQFATVAFILSLVNAAVTLDFGMSTIIGRDASDNLISSEKKYKQLQAAITLVLIFYVGLFLLSLIYDVISNNNFDKSQLQIFSLILILSSLIQNIAVSYLNGIKEFRVSGLFLFFSVTIRGVASLWVIKYYQNNINSFMFVQASFALLFSFVFIWLTAMYARNENKNNPIKFNSVEIFIIMRKLARKGLPLLFMGISATLVMQLDKIALAHFAPKKVLSAYYLAFTFSTIPILAIAGPIKQYFQPHIVSHLTGKFGSYRKQSLNFFWSLVIFVAVPSAAGYPFLKFIIGIWLGENILINQVLVFSMVLLPAFAIGALSYFPSVLLVVAEDYKFQSWFAIATSILFAIIVLLASANNQFFIIPWLFALYFLSVIIVFGLRCTKSQKISHCLSDVLRQMPLATIVTACAYGIGYVLSNLIN